MYGILDVGALDSDQGADGLRRHHHGEPALLVML